MVQKFVGSLNRKLVIRIRISSEQHGFTSGKSCTTQLLEFLEDLTKALDNGKDVDVIYLDFCKAFDKVPHRRLLKKLWAYGIRGKLHVWIKEFLSNRTQKVLVEGKESATALVKSGIPQGSVLGPILFLNHINDLPSVILVLKIFFADDAKLYQIVSSMVEVTQVQNSICIQDSLCYGQNGQKQALHNVRLPCIRLSCSNVDQDYKSEQTSSAIES